MALFWFMGYLSELYIRYGLPNSLDNSLLIKMDLKNEQIREWEILPWMLNHSISGDVYRNVPIESILVSMQPSVMIELIAPFMTKSAAG